MVAPRTPSPPEPHPLCSSTACELSQLAVELFSEQLTVQRSKVAPDWIKHPNAQIRKAVRRVEKETDSKEAFYYEITPLPVLYLGPDPCAAVVYIEEGVAMRAARNHALGLDPFHTNPSDSVMPACLNMTQVVLEEGPDGGTMHPPKVYFGHLESLQVLPVSAFSLVIVAFVLEHLAMQVLGNTLVQLGMLTQSHVMVAVSRLEGDAADLNTYSPSAASTGAAPMLCSEEWWTLRFAEAGFAVADALAEQLKAASVQVGFPGMSSGKLFLLKKSGSIQKSDGARVDKKHTAGTVGTATHDADGIFSRYNLHEGHIRNHDAIELPADFDSRRRRNGRIGRQQYLDGARPAGFGIDDWRHFGQSRHGQEMRLARKVGLHHQNKILGGDASQAEADAARLEADMQRLDGLIAHRQAEVKQRSSLVGEGSGGQETLAPEHAKVVRGDLRRLEQDVKRLSSLQHQIRLELMHRKAESSNAADPSVQALRQQRIAEQGVHNKLRADSGELQKATEGFATWHGLKRPHWAG